MRNPLRKFQTEKKVDAALLTNYKGYSLLEHVEEKSGERLEVNGEDVYVGELPHVVEINPNILPIPWVFRKMWMKKRFRIRIHQKRFDEPMVRDFYSGSILSPEKKREVLIEKGFMDQEGYMLKQNGERVKLDDAYHKVDVSDIDFIKAEYKALLDSKLIENAAKSMAKTGMKLDDKFYIILGIAFLAIVAVVFMLSGGVDSIGL